MPPDSASPTLPRVMLVDADDRVRESLTGLLGIGHRLVIVGSAGQCPDALEIAAVERPDIVVIDPRLPGDDAGLAFIRRLREIVPDARILLMSRSDADEDDALAASVDGWVRKTFRPNDLQSAILGLNGAGAG